MIKEDVIELYSEKKPAPWISNTVIAPKTDGNIRMTLDARNLNKAIMSTNLPIPRHEDVKSKLAGCKIFSKMDFKSAFWQIVIEEESRYLTVFHANDKLYRYKRLTMGLKPAQGELNTALKPVSVATKTEEEHVKAIEEVMKAISNSGLTLNRNKCSFRQKQILFWGMIYKAGGIKPDPVKVEALDHILPPNNKEELISLLCMMQLNLEFVENFAKKAAPLRDLAKSKTRFK